MPRSPSRRLLASALAVALLLVPALALGPPPLCDPPGDGITRALTAPYIHGVSTSVSATGIGALAGSPTPTKPVRFTLAKVAAVGAAGTITVPSQSGVYRATGSTADTLTGVTFESGTDQDFAAGDWIGFAGSARYITDINARLRNLARSYVSVLDFGTVVGDGTTDDGPAIQAILDANPSRRIVFPRTATGAGAPSYYSAQTLVVTSPGQCLAGETDGFADGTILRFAAGIPGVDIRHTATRAGVECLVLKGQEIYQQNSLSEGVLPAGFTTGRTLVANVVRTANVCLLTWVDEKNGFALAPGDAFTLRDSSNPAFDGTFTATGVTGTSVTYAQAGGDGSSASGRVGRANWHLADAVAPTSDGVRVGANLARLTAVRAIGFGRHGFNLSNQDCDGGLGVSDNGTLIDCYAANNRGYGFYVAGGDSNASDFLHCEASVNALGGIYDRSFLGNAWISPKTDENHFDAWGYGVVAVPPTNTAPTRAAVASIARSANLVTLTLAAPFVGVTGFEVGPYVPGHCVTVSVSADPSFDGTFCLISVSGAVVTYAQGGVDATPSAAGATAARALLVDAWDSALIPRNSGSYRTNNQATHRSTWIQPYSEGGQRPLGEADLYDTCQFGAGCTIVNGNTTPDYAYASPLIVGVIDEGFQGFTTGGFPSLRAPVDRDAIYLEKVGKTANQATFRRRVAWDYNGGSGATLWTEIEGPGYKRLYNNATTAAPLVTCWNVDHASGRVEFGAPPVFPNFTTAARPTTGLVVGSTGLDTTLHMLITWDGVSWRDQAGNVR